MLGLWRMFCGGMSPVLPESGGSGDQAAIMLDAFASMSSAEKLIKPGD